MQPTKEERAARDAQTKARAISAARSIAASKVEDAIDNLRHAIDLLEDYNADEDVRSILAVAAMGSERAAARLKERSDA